MKAHVEKVDMLIWTLYSKELEKMKYLYHSYALYPKSSFLLG